MPLLHKNYNLPQHMARMVGCHMRGKFVEFLFDVLAHTEFHGYNSLPDLPIDFEQE